MDHGELQRVVEYVQSRFTAYDRDKVIVHTDSEECLAPLRLEENVEDDDDVPIQLHVVGWTKKDNHRETCPREEFAQNYYSSVRTWDNTVRLPERWVTPVRPCHHFRRTLNCPFNIPKMLRAEFGTTRFPTTLYRILSRLLEDDRRIFWVPLAILNSVSCFILCCIAAPRRRSHRRVSRQRSAHSYKTRRRRNNPQGMEGTNRAPYSSHSRANPTQHDLSRPAYENNRRRPMSSVHAVEMDQLRSHSGSNARPTGSEQASQMCEIESNLRQSSPRSFTFWGKSARFQV